MKLSVVVASCLATLACPLSGCGGSAADAPPANHAGAMGRAGGGSSAGDGGSAAGGKIDSGSSGLGGAGAAGSAGNTGSAGNAGSPVASSGGSAAGTPADAGAGGSAAEPEPGYPPRADVLQVLERVNRQFADKWPDPGAPIVVGGVSRPSNIWTRAVYYEGLLGLYAVDPQPQFVSYAVAWGEAHAWGLRDNDATTTNADNQCAGQTYLDLYELDGAQDAQRIAAIQTSIDGMLAKQVTNAWTWVDAIQMSMPVYARLGALQPTGGYFEAMYALYSYPKRTLGLFNTSDHLWWRDANWKAQQTPSGKQVYWSRGNGWVFAALARSLERLPATDPHRAEYEQDFTAMARALLSVQRDDGFWNPSLADASHFGGPESSGTALFVYGLAWGIRSGLLDEPSYAPALLHAWQALVDVAIQPNGFVGYAQSTGDDPSDGQPLSASKTPDFEDYGVGCVLLGGSELAKLSTR